MIKVIWQNPRDIPEVKKGSEKEFWIAVEDNRGGTKKIRTFLAQYQNRPFDQESYDNNVDGFDDDCLVDVDGEFISSVGWVSCKEHTDFDNYYEPISFNENCKLLGWADYVPPKYA